MVELDYAWEAICAIVGSLTEKSGSLQEKLAYAYISQLRLLQLDNLPEDLRNVFAALYTQLAKIDLIGYEPSLHVNTKVITDDEAKQIIHRMFLLFYDIAKRQGWSC